MNILEDDLTRLNVEDILFIILIVAVVFNICGDQCQKKYINSHDKIFEKKANNYYLIALIITIVIYFYFLYRNYNSYKKCNIEDKKLFEIKLIGSALLISGAFCLIYFQINDSNYIGAPDI